MSCDGVDFELNTIPAKDERTGNYFALMRQVASRRTNPAWKEPIKGFVKLLCKYGLENQLQAKLKPGGFQNEVQNNLCICNIRGFGRRLFIRPRSGVF